MAGRFFFFLYCHYYSISRSMNFCFGYFHFYLKVNFSQFLSPTSEKNFSGKLKEAVPVLLYSGVTLAETGTCLKSFLL